MQQRFAIYEKPLDAQKDANDLAKDGWFVQTMTFAQDTRGGFGAKKSFCVVYRKKDKKA